MGGDICRGPFGCPQGSIAIGRSLDCDYCCKETPPTPTPVPVPCGNVCIPSFIKEGNIFLVPQLGSEHAWKIMTVLPSGWIQFWEQGGDGRQPWYPLWKLEAMYPVYVYGIE